jgi:catechol 2,3-dioxygenase-like lactoylglutathione lyase family enzyme
VVYPLPMRLNAFGIICTDIEASLSFYRMLGVPFDEFDPENGHYDADLGGGVRLMLDSEAVMASFIEDFESPTGNDRIGLAVECESPIDVDETYGRVVGAGSPAVKEPFDAFWGQRYATISDPDGNHVDLYSAL